MTTELIEIDSRVLHGNALSIRDFDPEADFEVFERCYVKEYDPVYVVCKIPMERVNDAHVLESAGFRLIESQIRFAIDLGEPFDVSQAPYDFKRVTCQEHLHDVLEIAGTTFTNDRFSLDRSLDAGVSGARYREYVRRSFQSPDEAVYRLVDRATGLTVAFKTHRYTSSTDVLFLLTGVRPGFKNRGIGRLNECFELNELMRKGIKRGITHISAANYAAFNLYIGNLGFRVVTTFAVLRKVYR